MQRYSAKLIFQFRVMVDGQEGVRRLCEERIIVLKAPTPEEAIKAAELRGRQAEHNYENSNGNPVHFEFIGIMDMIYLGVECDEDEVWYTIKERMKPMEQAGQLLPAKEELLNQLTRSL